MTTLSKDEIIAWAREAKVPTVVTNEVVIAFAHLCRADLVAENERLNETVRTYDKRIVALGCIAMEDVNRPSFGAKNCAEIARAENAALKADAERYRWLREGNFTGQWILSEVNGGWTTGMDSAIDAVMKRGEA